MKAGFLCLTVNFVRGKKINERDEPTKKTKENYLNTVNVSCLYTNCEIPGSICETGVCYLYLITFCISMVVL